MLHRERSGLPNKSRYGVSLCEALPDELPPGTTRGSENDDPHGRAFNNPTPNVITLEARISAPA